MTYWAGYALEPRIRVRDPARADWIVGWNPIPAALLTATA